MLFIKVKLNDEIFEETITNEFDNLVAKIFFIKINFIIIIIMAVWPERC